MPTSTVQVKYVNKPEKNPDFGSVKDVAGNYWSVPAAMVNQFAPDRTYEVEYSTTQRGGKTYRNIQKLLVGGPSAATPPGRYTEDPVKAEQIAVLAIIKEWVGKIPVGDTAGLVHALRSAREAWRQAYAKPLPTRIESGPQNQDEFNDDLPEAFR